MTVVKAWELWAVDRQRVQFTEPLRAFGERVIVRLVWTVEDYKAGDVDYCIHCQPTDDSDVAARISAVYGGQSGDSQCDWCFGTGFEGGFEPEIYITYMLAVDAPDTRAIGRSGTDVREMPDVQFGPEPRLNTGDLVIRVREWNEDEVTPITEEGRYQMTTVREETLRTGLRVGTEDRVLIAQLTNIRDLPHDHPLQEVPVTDEEQAVWEIDHP